MPTNPYFNNYSYANEQDLLDSLIIESIQIYGIDTYYIPRTVDNRDPIFREAELASFNRAIPIEMFIKSLSGFGGDGKFLSVLGSEIRDEMNWVVNINRFKEEVGQEFRPNEGDLIYFPLNKKVYQINFVDHESVFYQLGKNYFYDMSCDLFEYGGETFNTGITEIDTKYNNLSYDIPDTTSVEDVDPQAQNDVFQSHADDVLDWSEQDPFATGGRY